MLHTRPSLGPIAGWTFFCGAVLAGLPLEIDAQQEPAPLRSPIYSGNSTPSRLPSVTPATSTENAFAARVVSDQDRAQTPPPSTRPAGGRYEDRYEIDYGSVAFIDDITLPALEAGAIDAINVEEGQFIEAGTVVGQINASLLQRELDQARIQYENALTIAQDDSSIRAADKELSLKQTELEMVRRLYRKNSRSELEMLQAQFEAEIAQLRRQSATMNQTTAQGKASLEQARMETVKFRIGRHTLKSDYSAYVVEIFKKPQEFVNVGDDVMRLGRMDRLWVQGNIDARELNEHEALYRPVTVTLRMAGGQTETFQGRVDQIPIERQNSEQYLVKIRIDNRRVGNTWLLRPLAQVGIVVHLDRGFVQAPETNQ